MYKYIILSSYLFGSFYLYSHSLYLINKLHLENKKIPNKIIIINGITFVLSGSMILYSFSLLNLSHFKLLN